MKYVQNLRGKTEQEILDALGDAAFPVLIGGGDENDSVKVFLDENKESLNNRINTATDIQEAFNITYKPYIINGYDQRISLTNSLGFGENTWSVYTAGVMSSVPYYYNYSKVSPITFNSSNTDVATVDSNGVVTAITSGTTTITVSFAGNSKYKPHEDSYVLTVDIAPIVDPEPDYYLTYNGHKYVDLNLPSGKKWSVYNMGANAVNEHGDVYYYANTLPNNSTNSNDIYDPTGEWSYTKYNDNDWIRNLELSDDAAHVNWGGNWKIPSPADFSELLSNTTAELVTNYLNHGADGLLFTSKTNGNTLFFPLSDNGEYGVVKLMTNHLSATECPDIWYWGRQRGGNPNETYTYDEEACRWYTFAYRPVF